ncbi:MAG: hypothetical protein IJJ04_04350 [Clostridia bacterium]|nr:hypothetical protein [Clostridia bacterium]
MNNNLKKLFGELTTNENFRKKFIQKRNLQELYNLCITIVDGYSIEEFQNWLKTIISLKKELPDNMENLSNDDLLQIAGGAGDFSKAKAFATLLGIMLPLGSLTTTYAMHGTETATTPTTTTSSFSTSAINEITETAERCTHADFEISTIDDLNNLRNISKQGETFEGKTIILKNDITITSDGTANDFESIFYAKTNTVDYTTEKTEFDGTFNGNGKTLHCDFKNTKEFFGTFGFIGENGTLENINLDGNFEGDIASILLKENKGTIRNCKLDISTYGPSAAICSDNYGVIDQCEVKGKMKKNDMGLAGICQSNNGNITKCNVFANLRNCMKSIVPEGEEEEWGYLFQLPSTGGITIFNSGYISECNVEGELTSEYKDDFYASIGGIAETNNGLIENSTFKGKIMANGGGGIVSDNYAIIESCRVDAEITGNNVAEFVEKNIWGNEEFAWKKILDKPQGVINNCEFTGTVSSKTPNAGAAAHHYINTQNHKTPQITNCKINGTPVIRDLDRTAHPNDPYIYED